MAHVAHRSSPTPALAGEKPHQAEPTAVGSGQAHHCLATQGLGLSGLQVGWRRTTSTEHGVALDGGV